MAENKDYIIQSNDPQALEKLGARLEKQQNYQEFMKSANEYYRQNGTLKGFPNVEQAWIDKMSASMEKFESDVPYPEYSLKNNYQKITQIKERMERVKYEQTVGFQGWEFEGGTAVTNKEENRLQLIFDEKPDDETRATLKSKGFHWSPSNSAWQRQLTQNCINDCDRIGFLKPTDGRSVREHQPKPPQKEVVDAER